VGDVPTFRNTAIFAAVLFIGTAIFLLVKGLYLGALLGFACAAGEIGFLYFKRASWIRGPGR